MSMKRTTFSFLILALCTVAIFALNHGGVSSRIQGKAFDLAHDRFPLHVLKTTGDVYALWQEKKAHGRIVVHLGKYLHFTESQVSSGTAGQFFPQISTVARDHLHYRMHQASYRNFLWNAFQANIARRLYNVIPLPDFMQRFGLNDANDAQKEITEKFAASDIYDGAQRIFTARIPQIKEPVLLNIDASFFASTDATQLFESLMKSGLKSDLVTICLSEDNPDVTDIERQRLRTFLGLLSQRAEILPTTLSSASSTATQ